MGMRRKAREIALFVLYAMDFEEQDPVLGHLAMVEKYPEKLEEIAQVENIDPAGGIFSFARSLLDSTLRNIITIDETITSHSKNWTFDRIAPLDKNIMRLAVNELCNTETAAPVIIDEAIEISKRFCSENSGKFINGILNSIAKDLGKSHPHA